VYVGVVSKGGKREREGERERERKREEMERRKKDLGEDGSLLFFGTPVRYLSLPSSLPSTPRHTSHPADADS
jgi:hypothetical protein